MALGTILKRFLMLLKMARETNAASADIRSSLVSNKEYVVKERKAIKKVAQFHRKL